MNELTAEHRLRALPTEIDMLAALLHSPHSFNLTTVQISAIRTLYQRCAEMLIDVWSAIEKSELTDRLQTGLNHENANQQAPIGEQIAACISKQHALHGELQRILSPGQYRLALLATRPVTETSLPPSTDPSQSARDRKALETESAINAAEMLVSWAKLFAAVVALPAALVIGILALIGIEKYSDFTTLVQTSESKLKSTVAQATQNADKFSAQVAALQQGQLEAQRRLSEVSNEIRAVKDVLLLDTATTPGRRSFIESEFDKFQTYLIKLGYAPNEARITIKTLKNNKTGVLAYYQSGSIFVDEKASNDLDVIFREYLHHVLYSTRNMRDVGPELSALESGVADYLVASYTGSPKLYGKAFGTPIDLGKSGNIRPAFGPDDRIALGRSWAWLFYRCRQTVGRDVSDKLVLGAWFSLPVKLTDKAVPGTMIGNMLRTAALEHGVKTRDVILDLAKQRGAPVPSAR